MSSRIPSQSVNALPRSTHIAYGLGAVGTGAYGTVPGLLLLFFMTDTLGVPASLAGLAVFLPKIWDVVTDPLMGVISDRTDSRWGRRRPYLLVGALTLGVSLSFLFSVPRFETSMGSFWYVLFAFLLCSTTFTVFSVPYIAMPAEMTADYHERTTTMSYRMVFMSVGILVAGGLAPLIRDLAGGGRRGYAVMSVALGAICCAFMLMAFFGTKNAPFASAVPSSLKLREQLGLALKNRSFVSLVLTFFTQMTALGCLIATLPFFVDHVLGESGAVFTIGFVVLTLASIAAMPPLVSLSRRVGKRRGYGASLLLFAAMNLSLLLAGRLEGLAVFYLLIGVMGVGMAGTQLFPFAMLPDTIDQDTDRSGERREGIFSGMWIASEKARRASASPG